METYTLIVLLLAATIRVATPLLLAAIAGLFSERAGVIDLGLEGKMLGAAFAAAAVSATTGSVWLGLGAGMAGMGPFTELAQGTLLQFISSIMVGNDLRIVARLTPRN